MQPNKHPTNNQTTNQPIQSKQTQNKHNKQHTPNSIYKSIKQQKNNKHIWVQTKNDTPKHENVQPKIIQKEQKKSQHMVENYDLQQSFCKRDLRTLLSQAHLQPQDAGEKTSHPMSTATLAT